jgi:hypothetical protein
MAKFIASLLPKFIVGGQHRPWYRLGEDEVTVLSIRDAVKSFTGFLQRPGISGHPGNVLEFQKL